MTEAAHSKFSASAASRWLACPGSMVLSAGLPDSSSIYAAWGTVAHGIADAAIRENTAAVTTDLYPLAFTQDGRQITVDQDMVDCVNTYLQHVSELTAGADMVQSETRTNYAEWLGVPRESAWGTADLTAVWVALRHMLVGDLKTGMGVEVDAEGNEQGMLYAGGKLLEMEDLGIEIDTIDIAISQPRIKNAPSVWRISADELKAWLQGRARSGAISVVNAETWAGKPTTDWQEVYLNPTEKGCRWCKAKATCPALRAEVAQTTTGVEPSTPEEFADLTCTPVESPANAGAEDHKWLSAALSKVDLIEDWCKAVRAEVERRLLAGDNVPGYKLVAGKRGARQWADEAEAEKLLKTFRLKQEQLYDFTVKSPTQICKLGPTLDKDGNIVPPKPGDEPPVIGPRQWPKLKALIVQKDGKAHVAPLSDKRPALSVTPVIDDFADVSAENDLV